MTMPRLLTILLFTGFLAIPSIGIAQSLVVTPAKKTIGLEEQVSVRVSVSSTAQAMNAVSASLSYPATLTVVGIDRSSSIIDFWTDEPHVVGARIPFEGVALSPGYQGSSGTLFTIIFSGKKEGLAELTFTNAAILANDGLGSNILKGFGNASIAIAGGSPGIASALPSPHFRALPVITEYPTSISAREGIHVEGKGEPGAITKIVFKDASSKSIGEKFIAALQTKRKHFDEVRVKNDQENGQFEYNSNTLLVAGAYNVTPFLVDEENNIEKPGPDVQLLVNDSKLIRWLLVLINVLVLLIPIVGLIVLIYFIPWYLFKRMRVLRRRLGLEEEKIELSAHELERGDIVADMTIGKPLAHHKKD